MKEKNLHFTSEIVASFLANNVVDVSEVPNVIRLVFNALNSLGLENIDSSSRSKITQAEIRRSVTPAALISFIDGRPYKMLKRHLTSHGMTVAEYKSKFGLPPDYPMTAPKYSEVRSEAAKRTEFGRSIGYRRADVVK